VDAPSDLAECIGLTEQSFFVDQPLHLIREYHHRSLEFRVFKEAFRTSRDQDLHCCSTVGITGKVQRCVAIVIFVVQVYAHTD
jgi:hypothetical protein